MEPEANPKHLAQHWQNLLQRRFLEKDFFAFLSAALQEWPKGSVALETSQVLHREALLRESIPLTLENITSLRFTTRIDGILPLRIPLPTHIHRLADECLEQTVVLGLTRPDDEIREAFKDELTLSYLTFFHNRRVSLDYGLEMRLFASFPQSASGQKRELSLLGLLPNGGIITWFYTNFKQEDCRIPRLAVEHARKLWTRRDEEGRLKLHGR